MSKWVIAWACLSTLLAILFIILYNVEREDRAYERERKSRKTLVKGSRSPSKSATLKWTASEISTLVWKYESTDLASYVIHTTEGHVYSVEGQASMDQIRLFVGQQSDIASFTGYVWILPATHVITNTQWAQIVRQIDKDQESPSIICVADEIQAKGWWNLDNLKLQHMIWRSDVLRTPSPWISVHGKSTIWCDNLYPFSTDKTKAFTDSPPIQCVTVHLQGRLGNVMFQIAAAWAYAQRTNRQLVITDDTTMWPGLFDSFQRMRKWPLDDGSNYAEPSFVYNEIPAFESGKVSLYGYFQSSLYFHNIRKQLVDLWHPILKVMTLRPHAVSLHVRRGDYLTVSDIHTTLPINYYRQAIQRVMQEDTDLDTIHVLSDDINWCRSTFSTELEPAFRGKWIYGSPEQTMFDHLRLMMECQHHIIANSSFSWWGAYLSLAEGSTLKNQSITIAPVEWFQVQGPPNWSTVYHETWIKI